MKLQLDDIRRVLVVGSWAKEQITIEHLKETSDREIYAYMDTRNPAIEAAAEGSAVGSFSDVEAVSDYAKEISSDLVLVTTASPLAHGLVDELQRNGIPAFGPHKTCARLETDNWHILKWSNVRRLQASPRADLSVLSPLLGLDPEVERGEDQMGMFGG